MNGKRIGSDVTIEKGDEISYYLMKKQEEKPAFYVVYEDDNILIVDKESGVNSEAVFAALQRIRECYFIHRLDRNTQGLMAFALNVKAEAALLKAFQHHQVEKKYHALCSGDFSTQEATLTAYLQKDAEKSLVRIYDVPKKGAEEIVTQYKVLGKEGDFTRVEVILHTGKTHQIRAHLAYIGCPIVGDMKYGNTSVNKASKVARQCLVAKYLRFDMDGEWAYLRNKQWQSRFEASLERECGDSVELIMK